MSYRCASATPFHLSSRSPLGTVSPSSGCTITGFCAGAESTGNNIARTKAAPADASIDITTVQARKARTVHIRTIRAFHARRILHAQSTAGSSVEPDGVSSASPSGNSNSISVGKPIPEAASAVTKTPVVQFRSNGDTQHPPPNGDRVYLYVHTICQANTAPGIIPMKSPDYPLNRRAAGTHRRSPRSSALLTVHRANAAIHRRKPGPGAGMLRRRNEKGPTRTHLCESDLDV